MFAIFTDHSACVFLQLSVQWRQQSGEAVHEYQMPRLVWPNPDVSLCQRHVAKGEPLFLLKPHPLPSAKEQVSLLMPHSAPTTPSSLICMPLLSFGTSQMEGWGVCKY